MFRHDVTGHTAVGLAQEVHGECDARQLASGDGLMARYRRATGQHDGIELGQQLRRRVVHADVDVPVRKEMPSAAIRSMRRSTTSFDSLKSGMPYRSSPPTRSARSKTVTE